MKYSSFFEFFLNFLPHHRMVRSSDLALCLVTILFPPATAAIVSPPERIRSIAAISTNSLNSQISGVCSLDTFLSILLTILGYIPGHIHAFYLIYKRAQAQERYGENGYKYCGSGEFRKFPFPPLRVLQTVASNSPSSSWKNEVLTPF